MDAKLKDLFGIRKLDESQQQAAELYFDEAVKCHKAGKTLSEVQNLNSFVKVLGADRLPHTECKDFIDKSKYIISKIAEGSPISKDLYHWDKGLYSATPLKESTRPRKKDEYRWSYDPDITTLRGNVKEEISKQDFHWKKDGLT